MELADNFFYLKWYSVNSPRLVKSHHICVRSISVSFALQLTTIYSFQWKHFSQYLIFFILYHELYAVYASHFHSFFLNIHSLFRFFPIICTLTVTTLFLIYLMHLFQRLLTECRILFILWISLWVSAFISSHWSDRNVCMKAELLEHS